MKVRESQIQLLVLVDYVYISAYRGGLKHSLVTTGGVGNVKDPMHGQSRIEVVSQMPGDR